MSQSSEKELRVFVDSSVCFAAVLSPSGGSFRIFREARRRGVNLFISPYVIKEVTQALQEKYPSLRQNFHSLLLHFPLNVVSNPPEQAVYKYLHLLPPEDAPILVAAIASKATHLLTLDRKHFLIPLKSTKLPIMILVPGDFIKKYFT